MQIHELNNYTGELGNQAYVAVDNGSDTGKVSASEFLSDINNKLTQAESELNERIDNIIAGDPAPSAEEIIDARLGAEGGSYNSLGAAIRGQVDNLHKDITSLSDGLQPLYPSVAWSNGYTSVSGIIFADSGAQFGVVKMTKGQTLIVDTRLNNCTIIASTTAESVSVGDTVTPIVKTPDSTYQRYTYTATSDMNAVVCVRKSEFYLSLLDSAEFMKTIEQEYLKKNTHFDFSISGQRVRPTDGGWSYQAGFYRTDHIPCKPGELVKYYGRSGWSGGEPLNALLAFYDENLTFISAITQFGTETTNTTGHLSVYVPENAFSLRGSSYSNEEGFGIDLYNIRDLITDTKAIVDNIPVSVYEKKEITTTVLGADLPTGIVKRFNVSVAYATAMRSAITDWMEEYAGDNLKVPFVLHTDQHGLLNSSKKGIFDLIDYLVNWDEVSAIFNLGDTVVNNWADDNTNTNPLLRNGTLEDALACLEGIPKEKQINVYGNHDTWYDGSVPTPVAGTLPSMQYNNPYFKRAGLRTVALPDNSGMMTVYDDKNRIKYLILAGWDYADKASEKPGDYTGYQWYWINQDHLNWIVDELEKNEGYDVVIVSHVALCLESGIATNPITGSLTDLPTPEYIVHYDDYLNRLWNARKNKQSGTVSTGNISASFDFTNCTDELLCAIAGHTHTDSVQYVANDTDGLLVSVFDRFADDTVHFGMLDRRNNKIKVWKLSNANNTPNIDVWEKPFNKE